MPPSNEAALLAAALAKSSNEHAAERALEELCRAYWYPLYALVRGPVIRLLMPRT